MRLNRNTKKISEIIFISIKMAEEEKKIDPKKGALKSMQEIHERWQNMTLQEKIEYRQRIEARKSKQEEAHRENESVKYVFKKREDPGKS